MSMTDNGLTLYDRLKEIDDEYNEQIENLKHEFPDAIVNSFCMSSVLNDKTSISRPLPEIRYTLPDGTVFLLGISVSDADTFQMYADVSSTDTNAEQLPVMLAEVKKSEIAEVNGLPEDNTDIDVMIWKNPNQDDYTDKYTIKRDDIAKIN